MQPEETIFGGDAEPSSIPPEVQRFVADHLKPGVHLGKQRKELLAEFCNGHGISNLLAKRLDELVSKFDRVKRPPDMEHLLAFGLWAQANIPQNAFQSNRFVFLCDQKTPLPEMLRSVAANYNFWTSKLGPGIFGSPPDKESVEPTIWKSWLPLEGYYLSLKGGSGSGTFSIDMAIGFDERHSDEIQGQIWRVGVDIEIDKEGKPALRIIRTGSGQKSQGDPERLRGIKETRSKFLDAYKVSPQRLLLFIALEMAYVLKFDTVKGLSTQGAMELSLLGNSKNPPDYTASMTGAGFTAREGNWHEIKNFQESYYDVLAGAGYEDALMPHEVRGFDMILRAFNEMHAFDGSVIPLQLARDEPEELERAWEAYHKLHRQRRERQSQ